MLFGPLPTIYIEKLKSILDAHGASYKILYSEDDLKKYNELRKVEGPRYISPFNTLWEFVYIDIEKKYLLTVKAELEKMGFVVGRTVAPLA